MRVDAVPALLQALMLAPTARASDSRSFASTPASAQAQPQPGTLGSPSPAPSVTMLVTLAATEPGPARRRELARSAERGIDALDRLRQALLGGALPADRIRALRDWARGRRPSQDPELAELEREIELRILVELAKLERDRDGRH